MIQVSKQFPHQKLSFKEKNPEWFKRCIESCEDLAMFRSSGIRESYNNKVVNYNLANDILDTDDISKVVNPMGIKGGEFPAKMQNYPIANPKIDLLVGEERKRSQASRKTNRIKRGSLFSIYRRTRLSNSA